MKDPKEQADRRRNMVNVRSERILVDHKSYWYRLRNQRCLIPVSRTFDHRKINGWKKVPYYIGEAGRELFFIPGLYQWHETMDEHGEIHKIGSFFMLTRSANDVMATNHNDGPNKHRMPLFLPEDLERQWLNDISEEEMLPIFSYEMPSNGLEAYQVYTLLGYPERPDEKHRYERFHGWEGLPTLGQDTPQQSLF